jgi:hypothetical protein
MIYQLPNGGCIELSVEQYLNMSDAELDYLNAQGAGDHIDNPWFGSVLSKQIVTELDEEFIIEDLTVITDEEKLLNPDIDLDLTGFD